MRVGGGRGRRGARAHLRTAPVQSCRAILCADAAVLASRMPRWRRRVGRGRSRCQGFCLRSPLPPRAVSRRRRSVGRRQRKRLESTGCAKRRGSTGRRRKLSSRGPATWRAGAPPRLNSAPSAGHATWRTRCARSPPAVPSAAEPRGLQKGDDAPAHTPAPPPAAGTLQLPEAAAEVKRRRTAGVPVKVTSGEVDALRQKRRQQSVKAECVPCSPPPPSRPGPDFAPAMGPHSAARAKQDLALLGLPEEEQ